jgi:beta-lactamase regulating signal transducer with metallopeptidase domain
MIGAIASAIAGAGDMSIAIRTVLAATATWVLATLACALLRRSSPAVRHRVWAVSAAACLVLPVLVLVVPQWRVGGRIPAVSQTIAAMTSSPDRAASAAADRDAQPLNAPVAAGVLHGAAVPHALLPADPAPSQGAAVRWWLFMIWLGPAVWLTLRQLLALAAARALVGNANPITTGDVPVRLAQLGDRLKVRIRPRLLESPQCTVPLCLGSLRPCIILPAGFADAPPAHLNAVLTHELAHIARHDIFWQLLARLACGIYWFHPLSWLAAGRMRVEREIACDDWVLAGGESATRYARWLLNLASARTPRRWNAEVAGVAMVGGGCPLERRIAALLNPGRRRCPLSRRANVLIISVGLVFIMATAVLNPFAPRAMASAAPAAVQPTRDGAMPAQDAGSTRDDQERRLAQIEARALEMLQEVRQLRIAMSAHPRK